MKKLLVVLSFILVVGCNSTSANGYNKIEINKNYKEISELAGSNNTEAYYDGLVENSDLIIEGYSVNEISKDNSITGHVYDTKLTDPNQNVSPTYVTQIKIDKVLKGDVKVSETIDVYFYAGVNENTLYIPINGLEPPHKDIKYAFYLKELDRETVNAISKDTNKTYDKLYTISYNEAGILNLDGNDTNNLSRNKLSSEDRNKVVQSFNNSK